MTNSATSLISVRSNRPHRKFHTRMWMAILVCIVAGAALRGTSVSAAISVEKQANTAIVLKCRKDLAQRVKVPVEKITAVDIQANVWADSALGMPEPGNFYAEALTAGWRIVLEARGIRYLYTASDRSCKFGGPLSLWSSSMLYVQPTPNEPNMNGDLYQCSLIGTNHVLLASGVSSYYPQEKGTVLFTRRTSRSGYDLLSVKVGDDKKAQRLFGAFYIGAAALNEALDTWAAFSRPGLGSVWNLAVARVGQDAVTKLPLPDDVQPQRIAWSGNKVMILVSKGNGSTCFETFPTATTPKWDQVDIYHFPGITDFVLNKSESLEITQTGTDEKPNVEVASVWFTGDRTVIATVNGLRLRGYDLLESGYAFVWGEQNGQSAAYSVRISTGEVTPGFHGAGQDFQPFNIPPSSKP